MEIRRSRTFYGALKEMVAWLTESGVTHVAMESSGSYTMPMWHALMEFGAFEQILVCNAAHVKNVPGLKTDSESPVRPSRPPVRRPLQPRSSEESDLRDRSYHGPDHLARPARPHPLPDLGADFYTRRQDPERAKNRLIAQLEALGYQVTAEPA